MRNRFDRSVWDDDEDDDPRAQQALERVLGTDPPETPTSSTMPVTDPVRLDPPAAPPPTTGGTPWGRGQILGGARPGADFARLGGGFGDANTDSIKHTFGRIAQNFAHTPEGLRALMQDEEFRRLFPTATLDNDWIDFGGQLDPHTGTRVGRIDVMQAWDPTNNSGNAWQWLTEEEALGAGGGGAGTAPVGGGGGKGAGPMVSAAMAPQVPSVPGGDKTTPFEDVQQQIDALLNSGLDQRALMTLLGM